jgi:hypothetical protein
MVAVVLAQLLTGCGTADHSGDKARNGETGIRFDWIPAGAHVSYLTGGGRASLMVWGMGGPFIRAELPTGEHAAADELRTVGTSTAETHGLYSFQMYRDGPAPTSASLAVDGSTILISPTGVTDETFERVLAGVRVVSGPEWRRYRDSLPAGTIQSG